MRVEEEERPDLPSTGRRSGRRQQRETTLVYLSPETGVATPTLLHQHSLNGGLAATLIVRNREDGVQPRSNPPQRRRRHEDGGLGGFQQMLSLSLGVLSWVRPPPTVTNQLCRAREATMLVGGADQSVHSSLSSLPPSSMDLCQGRK